MNSETIPTSIRFSRQRTASDQSKSSSNDHVYSDYSDASTVMSQKPALLQNPILNLDSGYEKNSLVNSRSSIRSDYSDSSDASSPKLSSISAPSKSKASFLFKGIFGSRKSNNSSLKDNDYERATKNSQSEGSYPSIGERKASRVHPNIIQKNYKTAQNISKLSLSGGLNPMNEEERLLFGDYGDNETKFNTEKNSKISPVNTVFPKKFGKNTDKGVKFNLDVEISESDDDNMSISSDENDHIIHSPETAIRNAMNATKLESREKSPEMKKTERAIDRRLSYMPSTLPSLDLEFDPLKFDDFTTDSDFDYVVNEENSQDSNILQEDVSKTKPLASKLSKSAISDIKPIQTSEEETNDFDFITEALKSAENETTNEANAQIQKIFPPMFDSNVNSSRLRTLSMSELKSESIPSEEVKEQQNFAASFNGSFDFEHDERYGDLSLSELRSPRIRKLSASNLLRRTSISASENGKTEEITPSEIPVRRARQSSIDAFANNIDIPKENEKPSKFLQILKDESHFSSESDASNVSKTVKKLKRKTRTVLTQTRNPSFKNSNTQTDLDSASTNYKSDYESLLRTHNELEKRNENLEMKLKEMEKEKRYFETVAIEREKQISDISRQAQYTIKDLKTDNQILETELAAMHLQISSFEAALK